MVPKASASLAWASRWARSSSTVSAPTCDAALGVGLGGLVDQGLAGDAHDPAGDQDLALVQVHVRPAQRAQLAPAGAEHHSQPQEQAQLGILGQRDGKQPGGVLDRRGLEVGPLDARAARRAGPGCGRSSPTPPPG